MKPEAIWSREVSCLRFKDEIQIPDANERIKLAVMGLSNVHQCYINIAYKCLGHVPPKH